MAQIRTGKRKKGGEVPQFSGYYDSLVRGVIEGVEHKGGRIEEGPGYRREIYDNGNRILKSSDKIILSANCDTVNFLRTTSCVICGRTLRRKGALTCSPACRKAKSRLKAKE